MQIKIFTLHRQYHFLDVRYDDTIGNIKLKFFKRTGIPVNQQRFVYLGKQLENNRTIQDYNILLNSIIELKLRLRGD